MLLGLVFGSVQAQALVTTPVYTDAQGRMWGNPWDPDLISKTLEQQQAVFPAGVGAVFATFADIISAADTSNDANPLTNPELEVFMGQLGFFTSKCGFDLCFARVNALQSTIAGNNTSQSFVRPNMALPADIILSVPFDVTTLQSVGAMWYIPKSVPEPSALLLIGLGLMGAVGLRMRRK